MRNEDPGRDPVLHRWLVDADPRVDPVRLEQLAERIRLQVVSGQERPVGMVLVRWYRVVVPLGAAAGLVLGLLGWQATRRERDVTQSAFEVLEAMGRSDGDRYLTALHTLSYARVLTAGTPVMRP